MHHQLKLVAALIIGQSFINVSSWAVLADILYVANTGCRPRHGTQLLTLVLYFYLHLSVPTLDKRPIFNKLG